MKNILLFALLFLSGATFLSCERPPELPNTPKIAFEDVSFGETDIVNLQDSLIITISFEDGDGDLGLNFEDSQHPDFRQYTYFSATPPYDSIFDIEGISSDQLLRYGDLESLPEYNCIDYLLMTRKLENTESETTIDTVYVVPNPRSKNFQTWFYIKEGETFEEFDFWKETCIPSSGKFTRLNTADHDRPLQGTLSYSFRSTDLRDYFNGNTLKIRVQITDRAGHHSNIVESPEFTLDEVLL